MHRYWRWLVYGTALLKLGGAPGIGAERAAVAYAKGDDTAVLPLLYFEAVSAAFFALPEPTYELCCLTLHTSNLDMKPFT